MIISLIYLIAGTFLSAVAALFNSLNYVPQISSLFSSIAYFISFTSYFYGVLDVQRIFTDFGIAIGFEIFWFGFLIAWYVVGFFRSLLARGSASH